MGRLTPAQISEAFIQACRLEVRTLKPGNVHIYAAGHGMQVADFDKSADVAAPYIANPDLSVGQRIRRAVDATFDAVGCNTNLGIILLCAPLASAAGTPAVNDTSLHTRLKSVLASLTDEDTRDVFAAIARATPGGLGEANEGDVRNRPPAGMTLMHAMELAQDRDLIAQEYVSNFARVFAICKTGYSIRLAQGWSPEDALARVFLARLARVVDTHIARKFGTGKAEAIRARAAHFEQQYFGESDTCPSDPERHQALLGFDTELKAEGLNPGSLADLMAAVAFTHNLKLAAANPATAL